MSNLELMRFLTKPDVKLELSVKIDDIYWNCIFSLRYREMYTASLLRYMVFFLRIFV
ncbi:hypothetical protein BKA93DRAFT_801184 [Sparassis latifolia]